jgi:hypothetical protein
MAWDALERSAITAANYVLKHGRGWPKSPWREKWLPRNSLIVAAVCGGR